MSKTKIVVLRNNEDFDTVYIDESANHLEIETKGENGSVGRLYVPIETFIDEGKEHRIARWSGDIDDDSIRNALKNS